MQGGWIKQPFSAKVGERIGRLKRVDHPLLSSQKLSVDFDTGVLLMDINDARPFLPLKRERDGSLSPEQPKPSVAVLCVDESGRPFERIQAADRGNLAKRAIDEEMKSRRKKKK